MSLQEGWIKKNLGTEGLSIIGSGINKFDEKKDYLSTKSINGDKIKQVEREISYNKRPSRANMQPIINSVWFAKMKNTLKVYFFDEKNKDELDRYILSTGFAGILSRDCVPIYLKYFFLSLKFNLLKDKYSIGSTQMAINQNGISKIEVPFPKSLDKQQQIVSAIETQFSRLDETVENLKSVKRKLEVYRKAVLKKAFLGGLVENISYDKKSLMREIDKFNDTKEGQNKVRRLPQVDYSDLGELPKDWFFIECHKVCNSIRDGTHDSPKYVDEGFPLITSKNLKNGLLDFTNIKFIKEKDFEEINKRSKVDEDDILFAMIGTIGNPVKIGKDPKFAIKNVGLFKNNGGKFILTSYLGYWLNSPSYFKILESKKLIKGTTQKFIDLGSLRVSPVPVCSIREQEKIVQLIEEKFSVIDKVEEAVNKGLKKAEQLRKSILKIAFEGRLVKNG